ncbi:MAG: hypothetical protein SAJ37_23615 [Oscillatoria sp. PMC 1068.18]|nr:hypothetical protein [Oscillatoria sp. PMC 1076.18]MEC4991735.1 hypothetical protein [Oscillatoria sp. PMC 1068.18]
MTPTMLRQIWSLIESHKSHILVKQDDESLIDWLISQLQKQRSLNPDEIHLMNDYLHDRLSLIKDLVHQP